MVRAAGNFHYQLGGCGHFRHGQERDVSPAAQHGRYGGAEFINGETDNQLHAFQHGGLDAGVAGKVGPKMARAFYVHGHVIHQVFGQQLRQHGGVAAVGVQLHGQLLGAQALYKRNQFRLQRGLAAANHHAVDPVFHGVQVVNKIFLVYGGRRAQYGLGVAMGAAVIAAGREGHRGNSAGIINKVKPQRRSDLHYLFPRV